MTAYMLDTCICSFIVRERPACALNMLGSEVSRGSRIVISAIIYAEMRYGQIDKKASLKHKTMVDEFVRRLDAVLPRDLHAVDSTIAIKTGLSKVGKSIGANDTAIAGHALAAQCVLITNNVREFSRIPGLHYEDWVH